MCISMQRTPCLRLLTVTAYATELSIAAGCCEWFQASKLCSLFRSKKPRLCPRTTRIMRSESGLPPAVSGVAECRRRRSTVVWGLLAWHTKHTEMAGLSYITVDSEQHCRWPPATGAGRWLVPPPTASAGRIRLGTLPLWSRRIGVRSPLSLPLFVMCIHINIYK